MSVEAPNVIYALNSLPDIITGPGDYVTRDGRRVTIHEVAEPGPDPTVTQCRAKGAVWKEFRGKVRPRGFNIWHTSGRSFILNESRSDIVGVWSEL